MRYLHALSQKDLSLTTSMIPLGSCTMKLNAAAELMPVSLPGFAGMHPFAPVEQAAGYAVVIDELSAWLCEITGFAAMSLQPNSGASGEYAGLLAIRAYHESRGEAHRTVCLIPDSAHGTNPASAVMAGMQVVPVKTRADGTVDLDDLTAKADLHADRLAALMVTYPSTFGVFESRHPRRLRGGPRARRAGLHGRRQHERAGRPLPPRRHRRRRVPPEPAQDLRHPARRRRAGRRADRRRRAPRAVPARPPGRGDRRRARHRGRRGRAVRLGLDPAHLVGLHRHDGRRRAHRGDEGGDPQRQLPHGAPEGRLRDRLHGRARTLRARVHPRPAPLQGRRPASRRWTSPSASWTTATTRRRCRGRSWAR